MLRWFQLVLKPSNDASTDQITQPTITDQVDQITADFEGDSLIIDEARSGPIAQTDNVLEDVQYGTSFANSIDFKTDSGYKIVKFHPHDDLFNIQPKNDYELKISRFYLPSLNKYERIPDAIIDEKYQYTVDEILKKIEVEKQQKLSKVLPLTDEQLKTVNQIFSDRNSSRKVISKFQIDVTIKDLQTLRPGKWLNDVVIDFYLSLVSDINPKYFSWTSHFFTTLQDRGYAGVKRWGKRRKLNLFEKDIVFIPINISSTHWALATIDNTKKTIQYYDSLSSYGGEFHGLRLIKSYMKGETERLGINVDVDSYQILPNIQVPQQKNGFDCGVFTCICASYLARASRLDYSQKDMVMFRQRMVYEILVGHLLT